MVRWAGGGIILSSVVTRYQLGLARQVSSPGLARLGVGLGALGEREASDHGGRHQPGGECLERGARGRERAARPGATGALDRNIGPCATSIRRCIR